MFSFENVPLGNWIVRELQPAEGYLPNTDIHHVQVERDEQLIEITVVNDKVPELGTTASIGGEKEVNATEVTRIFSGQQAQGLSEQSIAILTANFVLPQNTVIGLFELLALVAFAYCVIKIFFANIKRGGILLIQMAVGALYMFSVPRGYTDGFNQWVKQIIALCLTAFLQTTLLFLGLLTFSDNMLLALGIMLAAGEVPRIAQQFGLDSSVKVNMMSVVHATSTAVNMTRSVAKAIA